MRALLAAAMFVGGAAIAEEEITFKGVPLGAPASQFLAVVPGADCKNSRCYLSVPRACGTSRPIESAEVAGCAAKYSYGGHVPSGIMGTFKNDAMVSVLIVIQHQAFDALAITIEERFGKPERDETYTIQNRAGATFDNRRLGWQRGDTVLVLTKRAGKIDEGSVFIGSKADVARASREREQKAKEAAKDL